MLKNEEDKIIINHNIKNEEIMEDINNFLNEKNIYKELIFDLIEKIEIDENKNVNIFFNINENLKIRSLNE